MDFAGRTVINLRALSDEDTHGDYAVFFHNDTFDDLAAGADEAVVFDDCRGGLQRFQHAADTDTAGKVAVLTDLCAGAHCGPSVDHGVLADVGTDVDKRGHQHDTRSDVAAVAGDCGRNTADAGFFPIGLGKMIEAGGHLVKKDRSPARTILFG